MNISSSYQTNFTVKPFNVAKLLIAITLILLVGHLGFLALRQLLGSNSMLLRIFDFDTERSLATFYSGGLLLFNSVLFFILSQAQTSSKIRRGATFLGSVFCFLALDEVLSLHENLIDPIRELLGTSGALYYAWVIPYGLASLFIFLVTIPFLKRVDLETRYLLGLSGFLYVLGAVGLEMVGGKYDSSSGLSFENLQQDVVYSIITTCEEVLEMSGCIVLVYTLIRLIQTYGGFTVTFSLAKLDLHK